MTSEQRRGENSQNSNGRPIIVRFRKEHQHTVTSQQEVLTPPQQTVSSLNPLKRKSENTSFHVIKLKRLKQTRIDSPVYLHGTTSCSICLCPRTKECAFVPCGHASVCFECANKLKHGVCPFCRVKIQMVLRIYF